MRRLLRLITKAGLSDRDRMVDFFIEKGILGEAVRTTKLGGVSKKMFNSLAKACAKEGDVKIARELVESQGLEASQEMLGSLVKQLIKKAEVDQVREVLQLRGFGLTVKERHSLTKSCTKKNRISAATQLLECEEACEKAKGAQEETKESS